MNSEKLELYLDRLVTEKVIPNAVLIVRKKDKIVFREKFGYSDIDSLKPVEFDSVYRQMSMTKPVTGVLVMKLVESGKIKLSDPISKYLPEFKNMKMVCDERFLFHEKMNPLSTLLKLLAFNHLTPKVKNPEREVTVLDLLSHSSGIEQGVWGIMKQLHNKEKRVTPEQVSRMYSNYYLDFEPGTMTGYSALAAFDILVRLCEVVLEKPAKDAFSDEIFLPLKMDSATFSYDSKNTVKLYKKQKNGLKDVTNTKDDVKSFVKMEDGYVCGSGGLCCNALDYDRFACMLKNEGELDGVRLLKPETVRLMRTEAPAMHLEPEPGQVWGLSVRVRTDNKKGNFLATNGTFGWSGAFGTHFFVSPEDDLSCVFLTNVSNAGGSSYEVSKKVEELVFLVFGGKNEDN